MKEWLKHKYGYLNIDDKNIYVTKTGNWSEVPDLQEKNHEGFKEEDRASKLKIIGFMVVMGGLFVYLIFTNITSGKLSLLLICGLPILAYFAYQYLLPELGASFKIPRSKISRIRVNGAEVIIEFKDNNGAADSNTFIGLDEKGLEIIERVRNDYI